MLAKLTSVVAALTVAFGVMLISTQPALAWTHLVNAYDSGLSYVCGFSTGLPCLYWPEPNHVSSTVYAYLDPSISNVGGYNFNPAVTRAFGDFNNNVPAFNPYMYQCSGSACANAQVTYHIADLGYGVCGQTDNDYGSVQHASGQYYAILTGGDVMFNTPTWTSYNNTLTFTDGQCDGRATATHETGHVEGLGHTGHSPAIMRTDGTGMTYYSLQQDDIDGLVAFYTGYIPA